MTEVTFFNAHPPNTRILQIAVDSWVGQEVPLYSNGMMMGTAEITNVVVDEEGIRVSYKTDADMGIKLEVPGFLEAQWFGSVGLLPESSPD